jgi:hypothetical protein
MIACFNTQDQTYSVRLPGGWIDCLSEHDATYRLIGEMRFSLGAAQQLLADARELERSGYGIVVEYLPLERQRRWRTKGCEWDGCAMTEREMFDVLRDRHVDRRSAKHIMHAAKLVGEIRAAQPEPTVNSPDPKPVPARFARFADVVQRFLTECAV